MGAESEPWSSDSPVTVSPVTVSPVTVTVSLTAVILYLLYRHLTSLPTRPADYPPGPPGLPLYGNVLDIRRSDQTGPGVLDRWAAQYGPVYSLRLGVYDAVVLNTAEAIREALVKLGDRTSGRPTHIFLFRAVIGKFGIAMNDGDDWKSNRRAALQAMRDFGMGKKSLEERILEEARALVEEMEAEGGAPFDPLIMLQNAFSNIICSIVFGRRYDYQDPEFQVMAQSITDMFRQGGFKTPELFVPILTILAPILNPTFFRINRSFLQLSTHIKAEIKRHMETFDPEDIKSFIDIYLKAERDGELKDKNMEKNLISSITDLFVAGTETSSTTLRWALLYLVHNPRVQTNCQREISQEIGDRQPRNSDRSRLTYVEATIAEIQRITSIAAYGVMHRTTSETQLGGYTIPKDVIILTNLYHVHMDPDYWGDPEVFRPERWIGADGGLLKHPANLPFSIGPRECLGKSLALQELFIILVSLLQKFTFRAKDPDNPPSLQGIMGVSHGPLDYEIVAKPL